MDFKNEVLNLGIKLNTIQENQFLTYFNELVEVNQYMNLTAITEKEDVYRKHFLDSLEIVRALDQKEAYTLCDVGSGAGFPSIPWAIVDSNVNVTIIDALNKRIKFLNELTNKLGLNNVNALHKRAEDYVKEVGASFDVVTARAVARLNVLVELCLPLVKVGGKFIAMKGSSGQDELEEAKKGINILGGKIIDVIDVVLPDEEEKRQLIIIYKEKETPKKYPRSFAKIKERPL